MILPLNILHNGTTGSLFINDIYVKNTGDSINGDLDISGDIIIKKEGAEDASLQLRNARTNMQIVTSGNANRITFCDCENNIPFLSIDGDTQNVNIGEYSFGTEKLDINGNVKIRGYIQLEETIDNLDGKLMIANNGYYKGIAMTGDTLIDKNGLVLIQNEKIWNKHIKSNLDYVDRIDIDKTKLRVNTRYFQLTQNTIDFNEQTVLLRDRPDQDQLIEGNFTIRKKYNKAGIRLISEENNDISISFENTDKTDGFKIFKPTGKGDLHFHSLKNNDTKLVIHSETGNVSIGKGTLKR